MREPVPDTVQIPCHACGKMITLPGGKVRAAMRARRSCVTFCSKRCNLTYVAKEGTRQQERLLDDA